MTELFNHNHPKAMEVIAQLEIPVDREAYPLISSYNTGWKDGYNKAIEDCIQNIQNKTTPTAGVRVLGEYWTDILNSLKK